MNSRIRKLIFSNLGLGKEEYTKIIVEEVLSRVEELVETDIHYKGLGVDLEMDIPAIVRMNFGLKSNPKIVKGHTWYKQTESWCGNDEIGTPVKVAKYKDGWVWYKKSFFARKYILNETSFRRIYCK